MEIIIKIKQDIIQVLYDGKIRDLSDIGNEIGIVIGKYTDDKDSIEDFIKGVKHGVSLTDGIH